MAWLLLGAGCATSRPTAARPASISSIHLMSMPVGLNLDRLPGADGIAIKVYAVDRAHPKAVPIQSGTLDVLMFDGTVKASELATNTPLRVWSFTPETLPPFGGETSIGHGYSLTLTWGTNQPQQSKITVAARYQPPHGPPVFSPPNSITVR